ETYTLSVFDDGTGQALYRGTDYGVDKWSSPAWVAVGGGMGGSTPHVYCLAVADLDGAGPAPTALYAGGDFTTAGPASAARIARWDGVTWSALGSGANSTVLSITQFDDDGPGPFTPALFVGGYFTNVNGQNSLSVARWGCPLPQEPAFTQVPTDQTVPLGA